MCLCFHGIIIKEVTNVFLCFAGSQFNRVKHRIDEIDNANFTYAYTLIEGDPISETLEKIAYKIKLVASPDGGSILKSTSKYHTQGGPESLVVLARLNLVALLVTYHLILKNIYKVQLLLFFF